MGGGTDAVLPQVVRTVRPSLAHRASTLEQANHVDFFLWSWQVGRRGCIKREANSVRRTIRKGGPLRPSNSVLRDSARYSFVCVR